MWRSLRSNKVSRSPRRRDEDGAVLLLVLLILALISVLTLSWAQEWRTELQLASNYREAHQCRRLAEAGVYYALGKLLEAKMLETTMATADSADAAAKLAVAWKGDQTPHRLELPGGQVVIRAEDEGGKLNINQANAEILTAMFTALGFPLLQVPTMVDSLMDWRSRGDEPRPYGAKSPYYLKQEPPYVARNGPFETVSELAWVRGFESNPLTPRLGEYLTAQPAGQGININTAPAAVLAAMGLPPEVAQGIVVSRQQQPFRNYQDLAMLGLSAMPGQFQQLGFQSAPFVTIKSTGMLNKGKGRHTVAALVRLDLSIQNAWEVISWVDDFPG
jgi:general secretion pathway protein K